MKPAYENEDAKQIPYHNLSRDLTVETEAALEFHEHKKEKLPQEHMANEHEEETRGAEVEPGVQCSGGLMNSLSSAQPED